MEKNNEHSILLIGIIISLLLLAFFFILQGYNSSLLKLDIKWLALCGLPTLISLFIGGYIKSFKGFGLELEARLKNPITTLDLKTTDAITEILGDAKQSDSFLMNLTPKQIKSFSRLVFTSGKRNYYSLHGINKYLEKLTNLKYFEVKMDSGEFICLLPVTIFKSNNRINDEKINLFIDALVNGKILSAFTKGVITLSAKEDSDLLDVLKILKKEKTNIIVVLTRERHFIGTVHLTDIEKRITEEVLEAHKTKVVT